ncbi:MAG: exo-alpha-sialidase [Saprospiraceae bacterium]|nr:exo-alpha-sialidase [Saprospiraceae bacterium]
MLFRRCNTGSLLKYFLFLAVLFGLLNGCVYKNEEDSQPKENPEEKMDAVHIFKPNIISTPLYERDLAITPDRKEMIYTLGDQKQTRRCLVSVKKGKEGWGESQILNISGRYQDIEPFFHLEGQRLYFASDRPIFGDSTRSDYNIWYSDREENGWSKPVPLDSTINSTGNEFYPSLSESGHLYFTATREEGPGREDIYRCEWENEKFSAPVPLPGEINTAYYEFNAFISPDERYLIFSSYGRQDGLGGGDLYVSEKDTSGQWSTARHLEAPVNSSALDYCPFVDADYLYFTSERMAPLEDSIGHLDQLRSYASGIENGFGNIYRIRFKDLLSDK